MLTPLLSRRHARRLYLMSCLRDISPDALFCRYRRADARRMFAANMRRYAAIDDHIVLPSAPEAAYVCRARFFAVAA